MLPDYDNPDPEKHAPSTAAVDDTAHTSDSLHRRTSSSSKLDNDDSSAPHDLGGNQSLPARTSSLGPRPSVEFRPASRKNERFPQRLLASYGAHHQHKSKHDTEDGKHVVSPTRPSFGRRPSDDSIRSNFSTTSSILSTASKISRLPHAVKSSFISVKDYVKSNKSKSKAQNRLTMAAPYQPEQQYQNPQFTAQTIHYSTPSSAPFAERDSFSSRLLHRGTPSAMGLAAMFSSSSSSSSASSANISPSASTSYSVLEAKEARSRNFSMDGQHSPRAVSKTDTAAPHNTRRRNSVVDAAARFLRRDDSPQAHRSRVSAITEDDGEEIKFGFSDEFEKAIHGENDPPAEPSADSGAVGKLLFGVDIGNMEFFEQDFAKSATSSNISTLSRDTDLPSDAKSDYVTSKASSHEVVWGRQRAKSCQCRRCDSWPRDSMHPQQHFPLTPPLRPPLLLHPSLHRRRSYQQIPAPRILTSRPSPPESCQLQAAVTFHKDTENWTRPRQTLRTTRS
ncbi:hypothetical protein BCR43DRAFT_283551 [Syncephalastrum racemosum]|uniref:Uncharacterized protein n=1 Tax=Syncephalastrum racemosum TaxID=13706 RepID=A0A1X2HEC3_SYNRA|nr:hypothetical protein BCR43DRAFT_283551 [Syncephalastrum racemosum]